MSKFSGKCDFYDVIEMHGLEHILNSDVYIGDSNIPLNLVCYKDCIPYFPYVVSIAGYSRNSKSFIRLTTKSWVDIEEERYGHMRMHDLYREFLKEEIEKYSLEECDENGFY